MFCSSKEPKEVFNLYLPSLQIQSFVAHSRRNNTRVSNHDQNARYFFVQAVVTCLFSVQSPTKKLVHSHAILPALRDSGQFLDSSSRTWLDPGMCFKYFFFDRKPKHEYYKPNNSAAAVTYNKNRIGKKKQRTKNMLKRRNETKWFF